MSLSYRRELEQKADHLAKMNAILREHFGMENGVADIGTHPGKIFNLPNVRISQSGGVYELIGDRKFEQDMYELAREGTGKAGYPHVSLT